MKRVLKWNVPVDDHDHPIGTGKVLLVACQIPAGTVVSVWTEETNETAGTHRRARVYGTDQSLPKDDEHIGSVATMGGALVRHVYAGPAT